MNNLFYYTCSFSLLVIMTVVVLLVKDVVLLLVLASMCCVPLVVAGVGVTAFDVVLKPDKKKQFFTLLLAHILFILCITYVVPSVTVSVRVAVL